MKKIIQKIVVIVFIIVLLAGAVFGGMIYLWFKNNDEQFIVDFSKPIANIENPIKTKREAVIYAIHNDILNKPDYDELYKNTDQILSWSISAYKLEYNWKVVLRTQRILPSYSCSMTFNKDAVLINERNCGWHSK